MSVAKVSEIIASSTTSFDDAIKMGVARAHKTLKNLKSALSLHTHSLESSRMSFQEI